MARVVELDGPLGLTAVAMAVVGCHDDGGWGFVVFLAVVVDGGAILQLNDEDTRGQSSVEKGKSRGYIKAICDFCNLISYP